MSPPARGPASVGAGGLGGREVGMEGGQGEVQRLEMATVRLRERVRERVTLKVERAHLCR